MNTRDLNSLFETIDRQDKAGLVKIVKSGQDLNAIHDLREQTPLSCAIKNNWITGVRILIKAGVNVNQPAGSESSPLISAVSVNNIEIVEMLLQNGADPDSKMCLGIPLHEAIKKGRVYISKILLEAGASINLVDDMGCTPLMLAASMNNLHLVKTLIEVGANPNIADSEYQQTALLIAAEQGYLDIFEYLLPLTTDEKQQRDAYNVLPEGLLFRARCNDVLTQELIYSAKYNDVQKLEQLISQSVDINKFNEKGKNALHIASRWGNLEIVNRLIKAGANLDILSDRGENALHIASEWGHLEIVNRLIEARANLDIVSPGGFSAVKIAVRNQHADVAKSLIKAGANLEIEDGTLLMIAAASNDIKLAKVLIDFGIDFNTKDSQGFTALEIARRCRYSEMVEFLKQSGAIGRSDIEPQKALERDDTEDEEIPF
ncbi:MAG: ankyrin repeat domain-containing protein [Kamptonema sp. SIO1D9]|nr:ankyrin repeat domain-containing protein [Kamptonema sp. SIO1D9]